MRNSYDHWHNLDAQITPKRKAPQFAFELRGFIWGDVPGLNR